MENKTTVIKPLSMNVKEAETGIINEINKYNLHPALLELILKNIYAEVAALAKNTYESEANKYWQSINEATKEENNETEEAV